MASITLVLLGILITLLLLIYLYFQWNYTYFKRINVKHIKPSFPFGNLKNGEESYGELIARTYSAMKQQGAKICGIFVLHRPIWIPMEPNTIKHVLNNSFSHFMNRGFYFNEKNDPLSMNLLNMEDNLWKEMRSNVSPAFSKMKILFDLTKEHGDELSKYFLEAAESKLLIDIKDVVTRYTTDAIGSSAFGINCKSIQTPDSEFRQFGRMVFDNNNFRNILSALVPKKILTIFKFRNNLPKVEKFFTKLINETVNYREENNIYRKDLLHLLIQLKNLGKVTTDGTVLNKSGENTGILSLNELVAQSFIFFIGGFETSGTTMQWAIFEMAKNQSIQNKIREEIIYVLNEEELTYEKLSQLKYMERVIEETLRKYPPFPILARVCNKDFPVPGTNVVIKSGSVVNIPTWGIHMDEEYYPNPQVFDPERFTEENKANRPKMTWFPFGEGPRYCIGLRFAIMQMKIGLVSILKSYKISLDQPYPDVIKMDPTSFIMTPVQTIYVKATKI